jgi:hypothetical protein
LDTPTDNPHCIIEPTRAARRRERQGLLREQREAWQELRAYVPRHALGFTFYDDGTVDYAGRLNSTAKPRARVLDARYDDGDKTRDARVTIVTEAWVETITQRAPVARLMRLSMLHGLALQAKARAA